jgi:hypothetical protein
MNKVQMAYFPLEELILNTEFEVRKEDEDDQGSNEVCI